ncbi:MAG TPA: toll/interleukin-1 receptor domain-containing protein [Pyrinomonadaceae bacterium]|nr:toll/interleukin-1 receptor domain-containing protein [Pyrinomonadaceae bacterium]
MDKLQRDGCNVILKLVNIHPHIRSAQRDGKASRLRNHIFLSYSHKDRKWLDMLNTVLKPLTRDKKISIWDDTMINSGDQWRDEIKKALDSSDVAVLLVSPDFLASDFIAEHELPPLLDAASKDGLRILWIAVRDSLYKETPLVRYQAANDPSRPLAGLRGAVRDSELVRICMKIKSATNIGSKAVSESDSMLEVNAAKAPVRMRLVKEEAGGTAQPIKPPIEDLQILRKIAKLQQLNEHVSDSTTVRIWHYPTAVALKLIGKTGNRELTLVGGQEALLNFKGSINALGFYYQQGMEHGSIIIKLVDGSTNNFLGKEFFPNVQFFGFYSPIPIDSLCIRTSTKGGSFHITSFYFYSQKLHQRVFADGKA